MRLRNLGAMVIAIGTLCVACANTTTSGGAGNGGDATGSGGDISYPTGSNQVILRISQGGGFVPVNVNLTNFPLVSLFGDGLLVTPGMQIQIYPGPALPALAQERLSVEAIQLLLQAAVDAGLDEDRDFTDLGSVGISDMPTTTFTLTIDGQTHTTNVYALGEPTTKPDGMSKDEFDARQALLAFQTKMTDLSWLPQGSIGDSGIFQPEALRVFVADYQRDPSLMEPPLAWPITPGLATFGDPVSAGLQGTRCGAVTGDDAQSLLDVAAQANQLTPWTSDGGPFGLLFRPLLPDESGC